MIETYFKRAFARRRMAASHLSIILEAYVSDLHARGHTANTIRFYVQAVEHFGRWLQRQGLKVQAIRKAHVQGFLFRHLPHCRCPIPAVRTLRTCRAAIGRLIDLLHRHGVLSWPKAEPVRLKATDRLVQAYDRHLDHVCGLSVSTRHTRQRYSRQFLAWKFPDGRLRLQALRPKDLLLFVNQCARTWTPSGIHDLTVGLRSFLRFLDFSGQFPNALWRAVPRPAPIPTNQPPTFLNPEQMKRFLRYFDRRTPNGRRDFAIALCLQSLACGQPKWPP